MKTRNFLILPLLALTMFSCTTAPQEKPVDKAAENEAVATVLESYVIANETKDIELIKQVWADDSLIVVFGTESGERMVGWETIKATIEEQFATFEDTYIAMNDINIKMNNECNTAWFSSMINYNFTYNDQPISYEDLRFTGVLTKTDDGWHIVQSHISVPAKPINKMRSANEVNVAEDIAADLE